MKNNVRSNNAPQLVSTRPWWKVRRTLLTYLAIVCVPVCALWFIPELRTALLFDVVRPAGILIRMAAQWDIWPALAVSVGIGLLVARLLSRPRKEPQRSLQLPA